MALAQGATDFQLLTDSKGFLGADNLQFPDAATLATFNRNQIGNGAKVNLELALYQF